MPRGRRSRGRRGGQKKRFYGGDPPNGLGPKEERLRLYQGPLPPKGGHESRRDYGGKRGDWTCTDCKFINFPRNLSCIRCGKALPKQEPTKPSDISIVDVFNNIDVLVWIVKLICTIKVPEWAPNRHGETNRAIGGESARDIGRLMCVSRDMREIMGQPEPWSVLWHTYTSTRFYHKRINDLFLKIYIRVGYGQAARGNQPYESDVVVHNNDDIPYELFRKDKYDYCYQNPHINIYMNGQRYTRQLKRYQDMNYPARKIAVIPPRSYWVGRAEYGEMFAALPSKEWIVKKLTGSNLGLSFRVLASNQREFTIANGKKKMDGILMEIRAPKKVQPISKLDPEGKYDRIWVSKMILQQSTHISKYRNQRMKSAKEMKKYDSEIDALKAQLARVVNLRDEAKWSKEGAEWCMKLHKEKP